MEEQTDCRRNEYSNLGHNMTNFIKINRAKQDSFDLDEIDDEWDENCIEIEEINDKDKGYVSCEEKDQIFLTETESPEESCIIIEPTEEKMHMLCQKNLYPHEKNSSTFSEYPIRNLIRYQHLFVMM